MPQMFFYGVTALATAMLNARRRFAAAAFAPVLNNVVVIAMLLAVVRLAGVHPTVQSVLDDPVLVLLLGLGTTAGVVAMALVLVPAVRRAGASYHWHWEPRHPAVRKLARLSGWTVGYVAANQVAFFVVLVLAYRTQADVSIYLAAFTFFQLPHGLLAVSVMTALGPEFAKRHQANDIDGLRRQLRHGPAHARAHHDPGGCGHGTARVPAHPRAARPRRLPARQPSRRRPTRLRAFAIGLVFFSVYLYVVRTFSSMQNTRTPFLLNVVENGVNVVTAVAFYEWRGVEGLAWSWTLAYAVGAVLALAALRRRLGRLDGRALLATTAKVVVALVPAAAAVVGIDRAVGDATFASSAAVLVIAGVVGTAVFAAALQLLGIPLIRMIRDILRRDGAAVGARRVTIAGGAGSTGHHRRARSPRFVRAAVLQEVSWPYASSPTAPATSRRPAPTPSASRSCR